MSVCFMDIQTDKRNRIKREFQGGYGLKLNIGDSWKARMISKVCSGSETPFIHFGYMAAIAHAHGRKVEYVCGENPSTEADIVIMQASMVAHYEECANWRRLKAEGKQVYFVGPFATGYAEGFLNNGIDVISGEPEEAFERILLKNSADGSYDHGIVESMAIHNLDGLRLPYWKPFPYKAWSLAPKIRSKPVFPMLASRSCPYSCNYCPYLAMSKRYRQRSVGDVIFEIQHLHNKYGMKGVFFRDPTFTANRDWTVRFCEAVKRTGIKFEFMCETRLDCLDYELVDMLYDAGLRGVNVGVENADEWILKSNGRNTFKNGENTIAYLEESGVKVNAFYVIGYPQDTRTSIENTIEYAKRNNTYSAMFFCYTPLIGTKAYDNVVKTQLFDRFDGFSLVYQHRHLMPSDIKELIEKAFVGYYWRVGWMIKHFMQRFGWWGDKGVARMFKFVLTFLVVCAIVWTIINW